MRVYARAAALWAALMLNHCTSMPPVRPVAGPCSFPPAALAAFVAPPPLTIEHLRSACVQVGVKTALN